MTDFLDESGFTPDIDAQLGAYWSGACSPDEAERLEAWIAADGDRAAMVETMRAAWSRAQVVKPNGDREAFVRRMLASVDGRGAGGAREGLRDVPRDRAPYLSVPRTERLRSAKTSRRVVTIALAACAIIGIISVPVLIRLRDAVSNVALSKQPSAHYSTRAGERATVTLVNGTTAQLGPATTLDVRNAVLTVTGEVLFNVAHQSSRAVTVRTNRTLTRVLGTRFVVRDYASDRAPHVVVAEGKVTFGSGNGPSPAVLTAGMLGALGDSGVVTVKPGVAIEDYSALVSGRLTFRNTVLRDILPDLARTYDVEIRVADTVLSNRRVTFTASVNAESLNDVLEYFAQVLDAHFVRKGRVITLVPGARASRPDRRLPLTSEQRYAR